MGGQTLAGLKLSPAKLLKKFGEQRAVPMYRASLDAIDFLESFLESERIEADFERHGGLWAAYTPSHYAGFAESQRLLAETFGHTTELVPPDHLRSELGTDFYAGGLVDPVSGGLNSGKLAAGLVRRAAELGVAIHEHTPVTGLERSAHGFTVATPEGSLAADGVVAATNGYTPRALSGLRRRILSIGSFILATEPLPAGLREELIPRGRMVFDTRNFLSYFRLAPDGRLLFGGRTSFSEIDYTAAQGLLRSRMVEIFPQLDDVAVERTWGGKVGFTFDQLPHIGASDRFVWALGYCGHGVAPAISFGRDAALLATGERPANPFLGMDFPTNPLYRGRPWFLPMIGRYYQAQDYLARQRA
jgi:glycine/D-amino acid oxidase-like deaminating enzyme